MAVGAGQHLYSLVLLFTVAAPIYQSHAESIYISNATDILFSSPLSAQPKSIYHIENGRIVGLAVDTQDGLIFWSDISLASKGIYKAKLNGGNVVTEVSAIISEEIGEVNGIAVDWVNDHIYWTDSRKHSIEVAKYDGSVRHVLSVSGLINPRGIAADPINGRLYWNDQGTKKIEQSFLDGSDRKVIASAGANGPYWPNQMVVTNKKLYYVDGYNLNVIEYDLASNQVARRVVAPDLGNYGATSKNNAPFGIDVDDNYAYVSIWYIGKVVKLSLNGHNPSATLHQNLGLNAIFSIAGLMNQRSKSLVTCTCNGGMCLQYSVTNSRCVCPSFGKNAPKTLAIGKQTCHDPEHLLFYTIADEGVVAYKDLDGAETSDLYIVGRSLRPVAVAYDPIDKFVYWSDVHERSVHRAKLDGSDHTIFMSSYSHSIGIVDGMAMDPVNRNLYYSNMGTSGTYRWHKIELISLEGKGRKILVETANKPRGLYVDYDEGHLYYTDWSEKAAVVRVDLDGSNPLVIRTEGMDNPNAITILNNFIYVTDSHYKTRDPLNKEFPTPKMDGTIYKVKKDGTEWQKVENFNLITPFGLTSYNGKLYVSDWGKKSIMAANPGRSSDIVIPNLDNPMGIVYAKRTMTAPAPTLCSNKGCAELCITGPSSSSKCTCDSYKANITSSTQCVLPTQFILVADYNSIKLISQDGKRVPGDHLVKPQIAVEGSSYFTNYVALAYDNKGIYYSDVNRKTISYSKLDGSQTKLIFDGDKVIDGMILADGTLYWTAFTEGAIYKMNISSNKTTKLVSNLSRPRAITVKNGKIFWTEWGTTPKVASVSLSDLTDITSYKIEGLIRPNAIEVDFTESMMYIGDGSSNPRILNCTLVSQPVCTNISINGEGPKHIYSMKKHGQIIYYTDWIAGTLSMLYIKKGTIVHLAKNLMRPTEIALNFETVNNCKANHGCSGGGCVPYPGGYFCSCPAGERLNVDYKTCINADKYLRCDINQCDTCSANMVCANEVGKSGCSCVCKAGYTGPTCTECPVGKFKPMEGNQDCEPCPTGSKSTTKASTECVCDNSNQVWDWKSKRCSSTNPGTCPSRSPLSSSCGKNCNSDTDCGVASKCCSNYANCTNKQCTDPYPNDQFSECIHNGKIYSVGEVFYPDKCITCNCDRDKIFGNPSFGYAVCKIETCPELKCEAKHQVIQDKCCPYCDISCSEKPVVVDYCSSGEIKQIKNLSTNDFGLSNYQLTLTGRDNCALDRAVKVDVPEATDYNWQKDQYKLEATATALRSDGKKDKFTCTVLLKVKDETPPQIQCPNDLTYYQLQDDKCIDTPNPTVSDNVCGRFTVFPQCKLRKEGDACLKLNTLGKTTLKYIATDGDGNQASCTYNIDVVKKPDVPCSIPPINYGKFECTDSTCSVNCNDGYEPALLGRVHSFTCSGGSWTPVLPSNLQTKACSKAYYLKIIGTSRLTSLPCPTYPVNLIEERLRNTISGSKYARNSSLVNSNTAINVDIYTTGCKENDKMTINIDLIADLTNKSKEREIKDGIRNVLEQIKIDFNNGDLTWEDASKTTSPEIVAPDEKCERGQTKGQIKNTTACFDCPPGTREEKGKCNFCKKHEYNDAAKSVHCYPCKGGKVTLNVGATLEQQCVVVSPSDDVTTPKKTNGDEPGSSNIPIIAGAAGGGVIVLIIVIVLVVVFKRRTGANENPPSNIKGKDQTSFQNPAFVENPKRASYTDEEGIYHEPADLNYEALGKVGKSDETNIYNDLKK